MGSPIAPPKPSELLIRATPVPIWAGGRTSRSTLIPRGMIPSAAPCNVRPVIIISTPGATAHKTEPTVIMPRATSNMRRLPYMSPSRPSTGAQTAPATSVAVTSHETVVGDASSKRGNRGSSGTTIV